MNRQQKESVVQDLREKFTQNQASFLVGYKGLTVSQMQSLRAKLREQGSTFKVAKARLMKRAAEGIDGVQDMTNMFQDQVGLVFAPKESPAVAKVLSNFAKANPALNLVVASLDSQVIDKDAIIRIAQLPTKEVLLAQVCGGIQAPITGFVNVLNVLVLRLLWVLQEVQKKKQ